MFYCLEKSKEETPKAVIDFCSLLCVNIAYKHPKRVLGQKWGSFHTSKSLSHSTVKKVTSISHFAKEFHDTKMDTY